MKLPEELKPVLAKIFTITDLGANTYHEVVYHDGEGWKSYTGSKTFEDAEQVKKWVYVSEVI